MAEGDCDRKRRLSSSSESAAADQSIFKRFNAGQARTYGIDPSMKDDDPQPMGVVAAAPPSAPASDTSDTPVVSGKHSPPVASTSTHPASTLSQPPAAYGLPAPPSPAVTQAAQLEEKAPQIQMRALIVTQDASVIIGKGGSHIREIREKSGARINVSEAIPNNTERILNVSGPLDAVSKAFGLIVRRINDEPFDVASVPGSRAVTIRFVVPHARMGSVIGKSGTKIKEIQEASGAKLQASEAMLPQSTERVLTITGVADAIHIAVYYVGTILIENQDRAPQNTAYRPGAGQLAPSPRQSSYGAYPAPHQPQPPPLHGPVGPPPGGYGPPPPAQYMPSPVTQPGSQSQQTQQIYIPNELVGSIIGKGGQKINEVRHQSGCHIKILDAGSEGAPPGERLVVITGGQANVDLAVSLLYARLEEEKNNQLAKLR